MSRPSKLKLHENLPLLSLVAFALLIVVIFYGSVLRNPDAYLFSNSGDGIKNYFTYAHHISNDSSMMTFEGMNYPYGEHIFYTDCHPVLANSFKLACSYFPFFRNHSIGILNLLMIAAIFLTFIVAYFLLREVKISSWLSMAIAISMALLAPQIFRLEGHYALSYSLAIPLSLLLLLRFYQHKSSIKYFVLLFINNLFWLSIHAYLGVIILMFLILFVFFKLIIDKKDSSTFRKVLLACLAVILPFVFYYSFLLFTDNYVGRTDNPSGFFLYNAEFDDVFVPHHPPLRPLLNKLTANSIKLEWEAWSYVGFAGTVMVLILIISFFASLTKKRFIHFKRFWFPNKSINIMLLASFAALLFAMAFPFKQFPVLLDWFPFVKQFRATGRFAWPFYFSFLIFEAAVLQRLLIQSKKPKLVLALITAIILFNVIEGLPYHQRVSKNIAQAKNWFNKNYLPTYFQKAIQAVDPIDYQAIIALPFYYSGSESYARPRQDASVRNSLIFSYHTAIPTLCAILTRTPVEASKKIVQMISPAFYPKAIKPDMPNSKPFLIIRSPGTLTSYESQLLEKAKFVGSFDELSLFSLDYSDLFANTANEYFDVFKKIKPNLHQRNSFLLSDSSRFFYYNDFENRESTLAFRGKGAYQGIKKGKNTFTEFAPGTFETGKKYDFSLWMFNGEKDALNLWFRVLVEEYNPATNQWYSTTFFPDQSEVIFGDWSLVEGEFSVRSAQSHVYIVSKGKENSKAGLTADDLLITAAGMDVYRLQGDTLFYNNHFIKAP